MDKDEVALHAVYLVLRNLGIVVNLLLLYGCWQNYVTCQQYRHILKSVLNCFVL